MSGKMYQKEGMMPHYSGSKEMYKKAAMTPKKATKPTPKKTKKGYSPKRTNKGGGTGGKRG